MDGDAGARFFDQPREPAKVVDVAMRDQNALEVRQVKGFTELGSNRGQARPQMIVAVAVAAAGVDERDRPRAKQQVRVGDEPRERLAGNAIDAHT